MTLRPDPVELLRQAAALRKPDLLIGMAAACSLLAAGMSCDNAARGLFPQKRSRSEAARLGHQRLRDKELSEFWASPEGQAVLAEREELYAFAKSAEGRAAFAAAQKNREAGA